MLCSHLFDFSRGIFHRLRQRNRRSFLHTLTKLRTEIIKSKQDTAKSSAYCSGRLLIAYREGEQLVVLYV